MTPSTPTPQRKGRTVRRVQRLALLAGTLLVLASLYLLINRIGIVSAPQGISLPQVLSRTFPGVPRVGLQIGHFEVHNHPKELAALRKNTGGSVEGLHEVALNQAVARELKTILEARGIEVDLLPATIPPRYRADLVLSIHADASGDPERRGYKSAHFIPARNRAEPELKRAVDGTYLTMSGLPDDHENVTRGMFNYYAFNHRRYHHSVRRTTPGLIVELGYISNYEDRLSLEDPSRPAEALAAGIITYLEQRGRLVGD